MRFIVPIISKILEFLEIPMPMQRALGWLGPTRIGYHLPSYSRLPKLRQALHVVGGAIAPQIPQVVHVGLKQSLGRGHAPPVNYAHANHQRPMCHSPKATAQPARCRVISSLSLRFMVAIQCAPFGVLDPAQLDLLLSVPSLLGKLPLALRRPHIG